MTPALAGDAAVWVLLGPPGNFFVASAVAGGIGRSFHAGVETAVWIALVGLPLVFVAWLAEALSRYANDAQLLFDGERGYPVGMNLRDAVWILVVIPVLGLPFGVIGAAVSSVRSRRRRGRDASDLHASSEGDAIPL